MISAFDWSQIMVIVISACNLVMKGQGESAKKVSFACCSLELHGTKI